MCQCEAKVEKKPKQVRYSIQVAPYGEFWIEPENAHWQTWERKATFISAGRSSALSLNESLMTSRWREYSTYSYSLQRPSTERWNSVS
jgi:hypothetical protein